MKLILSVSLTAAALLGTTVDAHAQVESACFSTGALEPGGTVSMAADSMAVSKFCGSTGGYTSDAYAVGGDSGYVYIGTGHVTADGQEVDLGMYTAGSELMFELYVRNTGYTYYSGGGERNPDGQVHAAVVPLANGEFLVGFEELFGGGDRDYNDVVFIVRVDPVEVSEPDADGDGIADSLDNCPDSANSDQSDVDADGGGDACDACPLDAANDADGDGVCGEDDTCESVSNADQTDSDGDAYGDACDVCPFDGMNDHDGDGVCGDVDNCADLANASQADADYDFIGDACDNDSDNDGVADATDNCALNANPDQGDQDHDGVGNACDSDDDNDGVIDGADACQTSGGGATVDASGCSIAELCPCDSIWKNHGAYVRCVSHASGAFVAAGLMSTAQKDATVSAAGQSGCGF